jgi:hypothetical protein
MRRPRLLILGAWLLHALAWFLPVSKDGVTFPEGLPGWEAFRFAAVAILEYKHTVGEWCFAVLATLSALTTPLFIVGSVWVVRRGSSALRRASAWVAVSVFILNAQWNIFFGDRRLRIGYFLWWFSFLLLAIGLFVLSKEKNQSVAGD